MKYNIISRHAIDLSKEEIVFLLKNLFYEFKEIDRENIFEIEQDAIEKFEKKFSEYIGVKYSFSTDSARTALYLILKYVLELKEGDEILLSGYTFWVVVEVIKHLGVKPIFVKIDINSYNIDVKDLRAKITKNSKVILVQHTFGLPANIEEIVNIAKENNLILIEDCAQSCGSECNNKKVGAFGDINYFSFAEGKNLTTYGGGMIVSNNDVFIDKLKFNLDKKCITKFEIIKYLMLDLFTKNKFLYFPIVLIKNIYLSDFLEKHQSIKKFFPYKLDYIRACLGLLQLKCLEQKIVKKIKISEIIKYLLKDIEELKFQQKGYLGKENNLRHTYSCLAIRTNKVHNLVKYLLSKGVDVRFDWMSYYLDDEVKEIIKEIIYLPNHSLLRDNDINYIVNNVKEYYVYNK